MAGKAFVAVMSSLLGVGLFIPSALAQIDPSLRPGALEQSIFEYYGEDALRQRGEKVDPSRQRRIREGMRRLRQDQVEMQRRLQSTAEMRRQRREETQRQWANRAKIRRQQRRAEMQRQLQNTAEMRRQRRGEVNPF